MRWTINSGWDRSSGLRSISSWQIQKTSSLWTEDQLNEKDMKTQVSALGSRLHPFYVARPIARL